MSLARARPPALLLPLAFSLAFVQPAHATTAPVTPEIKSQLVAKATGQVASFYAYGPGSLWIDANGTLDPAADELVKLIQTADEDGLDPAALNAAQLTQAVNQAQANPSPATLADAEVQLSRAFAAYVAALEQDGPEAMEYEASTLRPRTLGDYHTLSQAAAAPSLAEYIRGMNWMHPLYAPLRHALMANSDLSPANRQLAIKNLERIRQIPDQPRGRHIVIDSANATLWMYDGDKVADSMKVVVGKPEKQTPAYAGYIRSAFLNPYWNVPADMVRSIIARNVLSQGFAYLKRQGYEVVSAFSNDAEIIDPHTIDWPAVQRGELKVLVRQRPGPRNSMGTMKYEFPNPYGIYLHDTPEKGTLAEGSRQLSAGCIRLEDAKRLGSWLMQGDIETVSGAPEQKLPLPQPVPIYVTYLTAHVSGDGQLAFGPDPYDRDHKALASLD